MKKIFMLLPILLFLLSFQVSAQNTQVNDDFSSTNSVEGFFFSGFNETAANNESSSTNETSAELAEIEENRTALLIGGVVIFLGAMFVVRRKIKKSLNNEKLN
jgi:hypothetical protein